MIYAVGLKRCSMDLAVLPTSSSSYCFRLLPVDSSTVRRGSSFRDPLFELMSSFQREGKGCAIASELVRVLKNWILAGSYRFAGKERKESRRKESFSN